jgi:hypothetical protein
MDPSTDAAEHQHPSTGVEYDGMHAPRDSIRNKVHYIIDE